MYSYMHNMYTYMLKKHDFGNTSDKQTNKLKKKSYHPTKVIMNTTLLTKEKSKPVRQGAVGIARHSLSLVRHNNQLAVVQFSNPSIIPSSCIKAVNNIHICWRGERQTKNM